MVVNKDCESKVVQISFLDLFPYDIHLMSQDILSVNCTMYMY